MFQRVDPVRVYVVLLAGIMATCDLSRSFGNEPEKQPPPRNRVAVFKDAAAGIDSADAEAVSEALRQEGLETEFLFVEDVCETAKLSPKKFYLYVIPNAKNYPAKGHDVLLAYLQGKGGLLVLGMPPFDNPIWKRENRWVGETPLREGSSSKESDSAAPAIKPENRLPPIETVAPGYKMYPVTDIAALKPVASQYFFMSDNVELPVPTTAAACYARPEGKGFSCGYKWRWIPLIRAYDREGVDRGAVAWITLNQASQQVKLEGFADAAARLAMMNRDGLVHQTPPLEGSICAVCTVADSAALQQMAKIGVFGAIARRIRDGLFLSHAGSQFFSYWDREKVQLGAVAVNHGPQRSNIRIRVRVCPENGPDPVFQEEAAMQLNSGQYGTRAFEWIPNRFSADRYVVTTELLNEGMVIDAVSHELGVLTNGDPLPDEYVTVEGGDFQLHGKKWYPVGVNYWPRYAVGLEPDDYTYHWLAPGFYNPEEVERDLQQLESLGANFLAIRANAQHDGRNLLDFLRRCKQHDIRVMLFLASHIISDDPHYFQGVMMPYHFQEDLVAEFLRVTRLDRNPTLLGYDLIWEPASWVFGKSILGQFGWTDPPL